jgi:hypothetical protein
MTLRVIGAVALFFLFVHPAKADRFDFSFQTIDGTLAGSGFFDTAPFGTMLDGQPEAYGGFEIASLDGEVNGIPMVLDSATRNGMDSEGPFPLVLGVPLVLYSGFNFLNCNLNFTLDGQLYTIHDIDMGPVELSGLNIWNGTTNTQIAMTVIPVATPEPSTLLSCLIGLTIIGAFRRRLPVPTRA